MFWEIEKSNNAGWFYDSVGKRRLSYQELGDSIVALEKIIARENKILVALVIDNSPASIACYLAALRCGHAVLLLNALVDAGLREELFNQYHPELILLPKILDLPAAYALDSEHGGFHCAVARKTLGEPIHQDTAVLLTTSGTTGSPKLVRLSYRNIQSNAEAIVSSLDITPTEIAVTSLPFSYSYGLSVLNSHLLAGASLVCTDASLLTREFWKLFNECGCTSFAGVPYSYMMLERLGFDRMVLPSLRTMTQAGGRLAKEKVQYFSEVAKKAGCRFFVMYGQTEAAPRISCLPWESLQEKAGSVGIAIPGGVLRITGVGSSNLKPFEEGEIVYEGPNVMMGYAESRSDLSKGDELCGVLATGDIGYLDSEGFLFITGRLKRFIKIYGLRLNLDDVEKMLEGALLMPVACVGRDDQLHLLLESNNQKLLQESRQLIASLYHIHHSTLQVHLTSSIPVTATGKKDYPTIERELKLHERS